MNRFTDFPARLKNEWKKRSLTGPYLNTGDASSNSPGEISLSKSRAIAFRAQPVVWGSSGASSETCWLGYDGAVIDGNSNYPKWHGVACLDAAFQFYLTGDATYFAAVRACQLAQVRFAGQTGYVGALWQQLPTNLQGNPANRPYNESFAQEARWLQRHALAYMLCLSAYSPSEKTEIETWLMGWASYLASELHRDYVVYTPNRLDPDNTIAFTNRKSFASDAGEASMLPKDPAFQELDQPRFDLYGQQGYTKIPLYLTEAGEAEYYLSRISRIYGNRAAIKMGFVALVACITADATLRQHTISYYRDLLFYNAFPNGVFSEYERNGDYFHTITDPETGKQVKDPTSVGFPSRGAIYYTADVLDPWCFAALCWKSAGDSSLSDMAITGGVHGSASPDAAKTLELLCDRYMKVCTQAEPMFYGTVSSQTKLWHHTVNTNTNPLITDYHCTWYASVLGMGSLLYNRDDMALAAEGLAAGMRPYQTTNFTTAGSISLFRNGTGGTYPAMSGMFAGMYGINLFNQGSITITGENVTLTGARSHCLATSSTGMFVFWQLIQSPPCRVSAKNRRALIINPPKGENNLRPGEYILKLQVGSTVRVVRFVVV